MTIQPELWGRTKRVNPRRRFYKILGKLPPPFGLMLADYTEIYNVVAVKYDEYDDEGISFLGKQRTEQNCNILSQAKYGVRSILLDVGAMRKVDADCLRDVFLAERANPWYDIERA